MATIIVLLVFLGAILVALVFFINAAYNALRIRVPYVPTPSWAVDWLRHHLAIPDGSKVYELGCGDARVIAGLAKKYPRASFIGLEIQWWPYVLARWRARSVPNLTIERVDFWQRDISEATFVFGYYFFPILPRLTDKFRTELRPGTTVISFGFSLPGWTPVNAISDPAGKTKSRLLFYRR